MIYIETGSTDVYYNFGLEYYLAAEKKQPEPRLMFWRPQCSSDRRQNILRNRAVPAARLHRPSRLPAL